jgi:hypothetical protein
MTKTKRKPKTPVRSTRFVSTLVRRLQKGRRHALADEKRQAASGMYKCAIASHERALTLEAVLNGIKSIWSANDQAEAQPPTATVPDRKNV